MGVGDSRYRGDCLQKGCIDFVAVMLITKQVFHLHCLFIFPLLLIILIIILGLNLSLVLLMKVFYIKTVLFFTLLRMKKWIYHISLFLFIQYFIGAILLKRFYQKVKKIKRDLKKDKKRGWPYSGRIEW